MLLNAFKSALVATAMATTALGAAISEPSCLTKRGTQEETDFFVKFAQETIEQSQSLGARASTNSTLVNVYMHVVASGPTPEQGYILAETLLKQFSVIKTDFAPADIEFALAGIDWTINANWATDKPAYSTELKTALRRGSYADLNLYYLQDFVVAHPSGTGYCTLPLKKPPGTNSTNHFRDGCTMGIRTLPGGKCNGCNLGKITTHEVGHWLGLQHSFTGGCSSPGDGIADTPAHKETGGCPTTAPDTCPGMEGLDPIHNHMAYTNDLCRKEFTPMQGLVMRRVFGTMRQGGL